MPYGRGTAMSNNQCQLDAACAGRFLGHAFSRIIRFECPGIDNLTPEAKKRIGMSRVHSGQAGPRGIRLTAGQVVPVDVQTSECADTVKSDNVYYVK